ncbi:MAG TPA: beta-ketoacyl-[acyl-carrier-protein] synthase family protein [Smithellaceae bacterium]|nr:beta-ketoacyl-[acyl-carrier-protein] synthase family protein [Smithellaceae bacterium]HRS88098.1 beta-ketoacyl-[acyl-carrier-protein] synthase family protein [Smithellaceae bacterium]HRV25428.1 beta-ketoacyl-[acyl-carrier-protein] synthase family protein [Smithellaceae bacterium]
MINETRHDLKQRVVVTGLGMVTPLGVGKGEFYERLFGGQCGIGEIKSFDTKDFTSHLGAEVTSFSPRDFISAKNLRRMDRISPMAVASARLALEDAKIQITQENRDRVGIILGTAFGATDVTVQFAENLLGQGPAAVNPILVPNTVMNAPAGHASIELGFRGVNTTVTHYAVSAEIAIAYALEEIRRGTADFILAGGVDILSKFYYESLTRFHALSPAGGGKEGSRPFDQARNGFVASEGCGILCLESMESARQRGRDYYCEIKGFGLGSSICGPTQWPRESDGIEKTINRALKNAEIIAAEIDAVCAAANGGRDLDIVEAKSYENIFKDVPKKPAITALKGALGESFSGGGMRACALALSIKGKTLPPTLGLVNPVRPLNFTVNKQQDIDIKNALLSGISFGGTYAFLVFAGRDGQGA